MRAGLILAVLSAFGCYRPPEAKLLTTPSPPRVREFSPEFGAWLSFHSVGPTETLAGLRDRLDAMTRGSKDSFDRGSQSRVGYGDIRAELDRLIADRGPGALVGEVDSRSGPRSSDGTPGRGIESGDRPFAGNGR